MKTVKLLAQCLAALLTTLSAQAQGTFQNLNFESATLSSSQDDVNVPVGPALPGWSVYLGTTLQSEVLQNAYTTGAASVDIFGPDWNLAGPGIIGGNYTVMLQAGADQTTRAIVNASIEQYAIVPANTQSLEFKVSPGGIGGPFSVSFNGNNLSPFILSSGQSPSGLPYNVYGVNLSPYAGETGQLEFTSVFSGNGPSGVELDDIAFSPNAVPEPSIVALSAMGGLLFAARKWLARR